MSAPDAGHAPILPVILEGTLVRLEPLEPDHGPGLREAAADVRRERLWFTAVPAPEEVDAEIGRRLDLQRAGTMLPFATRRLADGALIGMTAVYDVDRDIPRVSIGHTWNADSASGTGTNPDAKRLLLRQAFEVWGCAAVEFRTDWMNHPSRAAIERLGAKQDGVLRQQALRDGYVRDTVVYSILAHEWPFVRRGLEARVARHAA